MLRVRSLIAALTLLAISVPPFAQAQTVDSSSYADPIGRFSVPVPTGWQVRDTAGAVLLADPEGAIQIHLVVVTAPDVGQGVAAAWKVVDSTFDLPVASVSEPPTQPGVEHALNVNYVSGRADRLVGAYGQQVAGTTYSVLFEGQMDALVRRQSQVNTVVSGFRILAVAQSSLVGVRPRPLTPEMIVDVERYTTSTMEQMGVPGASVAIVQGGQVVYAGGFGVLEQGGTEPVTPDTLMMIGSTTKTMTTLLMAQLVDEGILRWDEPVVEVLPSFAVADPAVTRQVRFRDLVCACTGVPRRDIELIFGGHPESAEDVIGSLATFRFFTRPGEAFQYSNQMVATGGYLAALAAGGRYGQLGQDYEALMQRRVFDSIRMPNTTLSLDRVGRIKDVATPHGQFLDGTYGPIPLADEQYWLEPIAPAGAVWSTANDMARYLITELHEGVTPDGMRIVSTENLGVTRTAQVAISNDVSYGLGWMISQHQGLTMLEHGGNTFGFTSDFAFVPQADLGIVVLANARLSNVFNTAVRQRVLELVYDQAMTYDVMVQYQQQLLQQNAQDLAQRSQPLDTDAVTPFLGSFREPTLGTISLWLRQDGALMLQTPDWASELRPVLDQFGQTRYVTADAPFSGLPLNLAVESDGIPVILLTAPPDTYRFAPLQ